MGWIPVGLSADLLPSMAMPARVDGQDLAIWRAESGQTHVWGDRCPHRGMRLSRGFVRGETLACIYHGWQYGNDGGCTQIPAHPNLVPPKTICATTYACAEYSGVIWVALQTTTQVCRSFPGQAAVRSLAIKASAEKVMEYFSGADTGVVCVGGTNDIALALQPIDATHCTAHALASVSADRKEVSR